MGTYPCFHTSQNKTGYAKSRAGNSQTIKAGRTDETTAANMITEISQLKPGRLGEEVSRRESFDYIFTVGMGYYGNIPLIELLEYKEVNRLEEQTLLTHLAHVQEKLCTEISG